jgi:hypothetical protein
MHGIQKQGIKKESHRGLGDFMANGLPMLIKAACGHYIDDNCQCRQCGCGDWHDPAFICDWRIIVNQKKRNDHYRRALVSISKKTCCVECPEIAKKALKGEI